MREYKWEQSPTAPSYDKWFLVIPTEKDNKRWQIIFGSVEYVNRKWEALPYWGEGRQYFDTREEAQAWLQTITAMR